MEDCLQRYSTFYSSRVPNQYLPTTPFFNKKGQIQPVLNLAQRALFYFLYFPWSPFVTPLPYRKKTIAPLGENYPWLGTPAVTDHHYPHVLHSSMSLCLQPSFSLWNITLFDSVPFSFGSLRWHSDDVLLFLTIRISN